MTAAKGLRRVAAASLAGAVVVSPVAALAQMAPGYYGDHMWSGGWHGWVLGPLMMLFWLALLVGIVVFVVRWIGGRDVPGPRRGAQESEALEILRQRFARGEIDKAEFEERRALLER